jgi:hypothetical protein
MLGRILQQHPVEDISVEDPPLEEVIADMFSQVDAEVRKDDTQLLAGSGGM